jgi:hypothetical protein
MDYSIAVVRYGGALSVRKVDMESAGQGRLGARIVTRRSELTGRGLQTQKPERGSVITTLPNIWFGRSH